MNVIRLYCGKNVIARRTSYCEAAISIALSVSRLTNVLVRWL